MSEAGCGESAEHPARRNAVARKAANGLALAATPTFAVMAVLSGIPGDGHAHLHGTTGPASSLTGMVMMYVLMSVFHAAPWLSLFRRGTLTKPP